MRIQSCTEIIQAMPLAEYVRRGQRVRREADFSTEKMDAVLMRRFAAEPNAVQCSPVSLRRLCYKVFLLHPEAEYAELMLYFIRTEQDGAQRSALVRSYLQMSSIRYHLDCSKHLRMTNTGVCVWMRMNTG